MSEIVHITFEKLTGLKGTIEGDFILANDPDHIDIGEILVLLRPPIITSNTLILLFSQYRTDADTNICVTMRTTPLSRSGLKNYKEHFKYGVNFLIKEWSYGGGVRINSQNPN